MIAKQCTDKVCRSFQATGKQSQQGAPSCRNWLVVATPVGTVLIPALVASPRPARASAPPGSQQYLSARTLIGSPKSKPTKRFYAQTPTILAELVIGHALSLSRASTASETLRHFRFPPYTPATPSPIDRLTVQYIPSQT